MKYYAVTDDPNELVHWGIKGMKWGIRRTDAQLGHPRHTGSKRPRSIAYKKAQAKLSASMRNGIQKVETKWKEYNSPANKQLRAEKRYNKQTERALQKARKGKLKYGKLDDWQVQRITDRLSMERDARSLSETEKTWGKRLRQSIGEGVIQGVGSGVGRITSEAISRRSTLKTDRKRKELQNQMDLEQQRREMQQRYKLEREHEVQQQRYARADAKQKARDQVNAEYYTEAAKRGYNHPVLASIRNGYLPSIQTSNTRAKQLQAWNERNAKEERKKKYADTYDKAYAVKRAEAQVKLDAPTPDSKPKKEKKKNKDKGPGASQAPISINIYGGGYGVRRYEHPNSPSRVRSKKGGYRKGS